jgi:putative flippase GtrA
MLELGFITISSHIAALGIKFPIVVVSGFLIHRYVTFSCSELHKRVQLFRYLSVVLLNLTINYVGFKFLVDYLNFDPIHTNMIISILTIGISYFFQKYYTFKISNSTQLTKEYKV